MLYATNLSKMLDEVFTLPYQFKMVDDTFVYDSVKKEKDGSTKIEVVIPGYGKEDLKLSVVDNTLTLSSNLEGKKFSRKWKLSDSVDVNKIKSECKNGILTISLIEKQKDNKTTDITID
jgi:HSP20 family molecular chaperone IbpA